MKRIISICFIVVAFLQHFAVFSQTVLLQEDFTTYQGTAGTIPSGWVFNYNGCYTSTTNSGTSGVNSYKFGIDQATITSPSFTGADSVHFWIKGLSTTTSQLVVKQGADTNTWSTVATINPVPTTGTKYVYKINSTSKYLRFIYTKAAGNLAFDDFLVTKNTGTTTTSNHIKVYFNNPVNTSVSSGTNAIYLNQALDDTLIAYINRAKYTIDVAVYNYGQSSGISNIATAINSAYTRNVSVRWIYDANSTNSGLSSLNTNIHTLGSPLNSSGVYGIMHNKFIIIDANSANTADPIVWTGSTNWNAQQMNIDVNNVIIFQDKPLALAYTTEFNEMWGSTGLTPSSTNSKFGPDKTDNTPHSFTIDGKTVELYFSPSDGTNSHILSTINSANDDIFFGVYTFTDNNDATAIKTKYQAGVYCAGIMDQYSNTYSAYSTLNPVLGSMLKIYTQSSSIYHNKFVIVDACNQLSDPQVLTGSHNWTISADTKNDENTVIIHDATIANIYYQSFYQNFYSLGGTLSPCTVTDINENAQAENAINIFPNPAFDKITVKNNSDELQKLSIYNISGQLMVQKKISSPEMSIDVSALSAGIYVIKISGSANSFVTKMIKE